VARLLWVLILLLPAACDRQLDVAESGSLALGQNLYRGGELDVEGPSSVALAAQAEFPRWSNYGGGLSIGWLGAVADSEDNLSWPQRVIPKTRAGAARMVLCDFSDDRLAGLPAGSDLHLDGDLLRVGTHVASADDCCLVLVCVDPEREGLPLTLVASSNHARLVSALPNLRPGWRREGLIFRRGFPWLRCDLERGSAEWLQVGEGFGGTNGGAVAPGESPLPQGTQGLVDHGLLGPNIHGTSEPGVNAVEYKAYGLACAAALDRIELLTGTSNGSWTIHARSVVPPMGWSAELAHVDLASRSLQVLLPPGISTDKGRNLAWAVLHADQPERPMWWLDAMSAWCASLHVGTDLNLLAHHPERPPLVELITDGAAARHSPYILRPLRALMVEWSRRNGGELEDSLDRFAEAIDALAEPEVSLSRFQAAPRGAFLRPDVNPGSADALVALQDLADAGATSVALAYDLCFNPDPGQGRAWQPQRALGSIRGDASWLVACAQARALGLEVQLWPTLLAAHSGVASSRLVRVFDGQRDELYAQLAASTTHGALMAGIADASVLSIGHDLGQSIVTRFDAEEPDPSEWQEEAQRIRNAGWSRSIQAARAAFGGGVVLASEDVRRFDSVALWSKVDALAGGLFPILEGTDQGQIPLWRLKELFVEHLAPAKARADELGLPLWIAPSGFAATLFAARGPGADAPMPGGEEALNPERQAQLLEALGHGARAHGAGLLVWKLTTGERDLLGRGLGGDRARELLRGVLAR